MEDNSKSVIEILTHEDVSIFLGCEKNSKQWAWIYCMGQGQADYHVINDKSQLKEIEKLIELDKLQPILDRALTFPNIKFIQYQINEY
ncbi:MAG: hypothetical protein HWE16_05460 [Gammaproteobacteria bacterium]|nr:hypothetical protein [Gammaproteobacteria bacterium]